MPFPTLPPYSDTHRTEQLKLAASGCQSLALALFAASVISPLFAITHPAIWKDVSAAIMAALLERAAFGFLSYLPASTREVKADV